jgi:hypothetical protein
VVVASSRRGQGCALWKRPGPSPMYTGCRRRLSNACGSSGSPSGSRTRWNRPCE